MRNKSLHTSKIAGFCPADTSKNERESITQYRVHSYRNSKTSSLHNKNAKNKFFNIEAKLLKLGAYGSS